MSELKIKNHFVPELYLKQWEDEEAYVHTYKTLVAHRNEKIWRKYKSGAIGYHRHLYTRVGDGKVSDEFENWFNREFESPAIEPIKRVLSDKRLSTDDWMILVRFLSAQDVRTPARLIDHLSRFPDIMQRTLDQKMSDLRSEIEKGKCKDSTYKDSQNIFNKYFPIKVSTEADPETGNTLIKAHSYVGRATWLHSMKFLLENTSKVLYDHKWTIVKPYKGYHWITSDNPVIKLNFENENSYDFGGGWGRKNGNIIFPLGPEHAMFVQVGERPMLRGTRLTLNQTTMIRKFIAENSYRRIFSNCIDNEVLALRPRIIDMERLKQEEKRFNEWHDQNSSMEREYF